MIKLSPTLHKLSLFAPTTWAIDNQNDADLGSVGPALLAKGLVFQVGKQQTGFLLSAANLGCIGGQIVGHTVCTAFGGTAYRNPYIYVPCTDGIRPSWCCQGQISPSPGTRRLRPKARQLSPSVWCGELGPVAASSTASTPRPGRS